MSEEATTILEDLDFSRLSQMGGTDENFGEDQIDSITGRMSFEVGPLFHEDGDKCAVFITYTPEEDSPEDVYTHRYKVGTLWHDSNRIDKGRNEGETPHQFVPGTGEFNGDGFPIPCNYLSEDPKDHFGVSIIGVRGTVDGDPKFSGKCAFAGLRKSLRSLGVEVDKFPDNLSLLDNRFLVTASRKVKSFKQDGQEIEFSVFTVDEVISDEPVKGKKTAPTTDLTSDEIVELRATIRRAISEDDDTDDVGRSAKKTVIVAVMIGHPGNDKFVAALGDEATLTKMGVEIVAKRIGIIGEE